ncbi:MAG: hypothetical protein ACOCXH_13125 [Cyclobacteriaceae bacterium]
MHKAIILYFLFVIASVVASCQSGSIEIFIRKYPTEANKAGLINFEIQNDTLYKNDVAFLAGMNKLYYRKLKPQESDTIYYLIKNINFQDTVKSYAKNKYEAMYYYNIYISYNSDKKSIIIFQDDYPNNLKQLIEYIERISEKGDYSLIKNKIEGIPDVSIGYLINREQDTLRITPRASYVIWKKLMQGNYELKKIESIDKFDYELNTLYPVDYEGKQISKILYDKGDIYLVYDDKDILLLKGLSIPLNMNEITKRENK